MVAAVEPASRFLWVSSGEPHAIRRRELLSKYGDQIRKLYGYDHATAYQVGAHGGAGRGSGGALLVCYGLMFFLAGTGRV